MIFDFVTRIAFGVLIFLVSHIVLIVIDIERGYDDVDYTDFLGALIELLIIVPLIGRVLGWW